MVLLLLVVSTIWRWVWVIRVRKVLKNVIFLVMTLLTFVFNKNTSLETFYMLVMMVRKPFITYSQNCYSLCNVGSHGSLYVARKCPYRCSVPCYCLWMQRSTSIQPSWPTIPAIEFVPSSLLRKQFKLGLVLCLQESCRLCHSRNAIRIASCSYCITFLDPLECFSRPSGLSYTLYSSQNLALNCALPV